MNTSPKKPESEPIKGIHRAARRDKTKTDADPNGAIILRSSQRTAWEHLRDWDYGILNAPTGWGKSMVLCALAADDLLDDPRRKVIVTIPQTIISKGFINNVKIELPESQVADWSVKHNLCLPVAEKLEYLREWMLAPPATTLAGRVLVTTHRNFAMAYESLNPRQLKSALQHTTLFIDEAHHIQASDEGVNQLGHAVDYILAAHDPTTRMYFATAYFFRGDRLQILHDNQLLRFYKHTVPFDEYWKSLRHLRSYKYDFVAFKGSVWKEVEALFAQSQEPTLCFCPPEGHRLLLGKPKADFVKRLIRLVRKHYKGCTLWKPGVVPRTRKVILDLVDPEYRVDKIAFSMEHGDKIAVILTVGMFREGADWIQAQRVIDLIPTGSDQDRNQRFGRLIRDCTGKTTVSYISFFQHFTDSSKEDQRRELTKLFTHFHASLVLENALAPIKVVVHDRKRDSEGKSRERPVDLLGNYNGQMQESILRESSERLIQLAGNMDEQGKSVTPDDAKRVITEVLKEHGIDENRESFARQIVLMLRRRQDLDLPVEDLVDAGFDKVWEADALEGLRLYSGGVGGPSTFREIRDAIRSVFDERWLEMYQKLSDLTVPPPRHSRAYWWIANNRKYKQEGILSEERISLLENIPWWGWSEPLADRWDRCFEELKQLGQYPNKRDQRRLYRIVEKQRAMQRDGKLTEEQVELLETIPWWSWEPSAFDEAWQREFERVKALGGNVPWTDKWATNQKTAYSEDRMPDNRIKLLEALPHWTWATGLNTLRHDQWQRQYEKVEAIGRRPQRRVDEAEYQWVKDQKKKHANNELPDEQTGLLEAITWWSWDTAAEDRWHANYEKMRNLTTHPKFGTTEYLWIRRQLKAYKEGKLEGRKIELLEAFPWIKW